MTHLLPRIKAIRFFTAIGISFLLFSYGPDFYSRRWWSWTPAIAVWFFFPVKVIIHLFHLWSQITPTWGKFRFRRIFVPRGSSPNFNHSSKRGFWYGGKWRTIGITRKLAGPIFFSTWYFPVTCSLKSWNHIWYCKTVCFHKYKMISCYLVWS